MFNKKWAKIKKPDVEIFELYKSVFRTTDGITHENSNYKWCKVSGINCSMGEYVMIGITHDGYITDNEGTMYPLNNVVSIDWILLDTKKKIRRSRDEYIIWFSDDELNEMVDA